MRAALYRGACRHAYAAICGVLIDVRDAVQDMQVALNNIGNDYLKGQGT